jgi:uncharacterized protein (TIGR03437 family)
MTRIALLLALFWALIGCSSDEEVRPVWIDSVEPASAPAGAWVRLDGKGFGEPADDLTIEGPVIYHGTNAVLVGGIESPVALRQDRTVQVQLPAELPPGPYYVVVWTEGIGSNAYPIRIVPSADTAAEALDDGTTAP